jgi:hypothetical protein
MLCIAAQSDWRAGVISAREGSCSASYHPGEARLFTNSIRPVISHTGAAKCLSTLIFLWSDAFVMNQTPSAYHRDFAG